MGLTRLEALQVKQQQGEFSAAQDVLVIEGELQDILDSGRAGRGSLRQGRHPEKALSPSPPRPLAGSHLHSAMDLVVEGLIPLRVTAVVYHLRLGMAGRCRGQPQLHVAVSFGHCGDGEGVLALSSYCGKVAWRRLGWEEGAEPGEEAAQVAGWGGRWRESPHP